MIKPVKGYKLFLLTAVLAGILSISEQKVFAQIFSINESFENPAFLKRWDRNEKCCDYSIQRSDSIAHSGKYSLRFELNQTDRLVANSKRAEIAWHTERNTKIDRWFSFSIFLPADYQKDVASEILAQWHESPDAALGETWRTAPISLRSQNGYWRAAIQWSPEQVNTDRTVAGKKSFQIGKQKKGVWTSFVFHIRFSCNADGLLEIWKDGESVVNYTGPNYYNDKKGPFFKLGIYKPEWKSKTNKSTVTNRVVFYDDVIIGNENADLKTIQSVKFDKTE